MTRVFGVPPHLLRPILALCLVAVSAFLVFQRAPATPGGDQPRYATLGLNLLDHGVFSANAYAPGSRPAASLAWAGPLIAPEIAIAAAIDSGTKNALACIAPGSAECDMRLAGLRLVHLFEILVFLACLWWIGRLILRDELQAWSVAFIGLGFREVTDSANVVQTEPLYLMTYGLFAAVMMTAYMERKGPAWWGLAGGLLGLTILTKTSLVILFGVLPALLIGEALARRKAFAPSVVASLCVVLAGGVVVGVWMSRSAILFHSLALTDPIYLEASLSHRFAYNRMTWLEWLGGWIYYLPDFGDDLGRTLFGKEALERLGFNPQGFYEYGANVLHGEAHAHTAPDVATGYLFKTYVLDEPIKFVAVSALLMWRGIFVGRILGMVGLVAMVFALWTMPPRQRGPLALLALLGFTLAGAHAALSVSIPRYNLALIPVYSVSIVWMLSRAWSRLVPRLRASEGNA